MQPLKLFTHSSKIILLYLNFAIGVLLDGPRDLTWPLDEKSVFQPDSRSFIFTKKVTQITDDGNWYAMNEFCTGEHGGTHFDAPYHVSRNGMKVGDVPLERLIAPGVCIDLQSKTKKHGRNTTLTMEDIHTWETVHGRVLKGSIVIVNFGWSQYYTTEHYLYNFEKKMEFPGVTKDAALMLADREVYGVGLDTASVDPGASSDYLTHRILGVHDIYVLENVKLEVTLPAIGFKLFVLPIKIREGTGGPVRIVAMPDHILQFPKSQSYGGQTWFKNSWVVVFAILILSMYVINSISL